MEESNGNFFSASTHPSVISGINLCSNPITEIHQFIGAETNNIPQSFEVEAPYVFDEAEASLLLASLTSFQGPPGGAISINDVGGNYQVARNADDIPPVGPAGGVCAGCGHQVRLNPTEEFSSDSEAISVLDALAFVFEYPTFLKRGKGSLFTRNCAKGGSSLFSLCTKCGVQILELYNLFKQFTNTLSKEARIFRTLLGNQRSRRKCNILGSSDSKKETAINNNDDQVLKKKSRAKRNNTCDTNDVHVTSAESKVTIKKWLKSSLKSENFISSLGKDFEDFHSDSCGDVIHVSEPELTKVEDLEENRNKIRRSNNSENKGIKDEKSKSWNPGKRRNYNWRKDKWIEKVKGDPSRTCDLCHKSFIFPAVMRRHQRIVHEGYKPFECKSCGRRFTQKVILNKHNCDFSKETETDNRDYLHLAREEELRKFVCSFQNCGKRFKYPTHLNLHEMNHRNERPFPCNECDKSFRRPDHLKYHVRIVHVEEKKFVCTQCPSTFKSISSLRAHEKKHVTEQVHLCTICGKSIKSMYQMTRHQKTHQEELPYECRFCGKRFKMKDYLGQHLRRGKSCSKKPTNSSLISAS